MGANSLSHTRWDCSYHIIFIPKYRRKVFFKEIRREVGEILRTLCEYKDVELVEGSISLDHVHIYVKIPPKLSVSEFMGYLYRKKDFIERHFPNSVKFNDSRENIFP